MTNDELLDRLRNMVHWCGTIDDHEALNAVIDLIADNKRLQGEYERGLRDAAEIAQYVVKNYEVMDHTGTKYLPPKMQVAAKGMVRIVLEDINAAADKHSDQNREKLTATKVRKATPAARC